MIPPLPPADGQSHFHAILRTLPVAAYICDPDGRITYFNSAAVELWGRTPLVRDDADRFCGSHRLLTPTGQLVPHDQCWMALALRENKGFNGREIVVEHPDGTRRPTTAHANPTRDAGGALNGAVNVLVDVAGRGAGEIIGALVTRLHAALAEVRALRGVITICCHCHQVRTETDLWHPIADYITEKTNAVCSHGICPDCLTKHYSNYLLGKYNTGEMA